jgi:hypothetical protein
MKIDIYTKAVLTIIAVSLSAIAIQMAIGNAYAAEAVTKVTICNELGRGCGKGYGFDPLYVKSSGL